MKRILSLLVATLLAVAMLVGCTTEQPKESPTKDPSGNETAAPSETSGSETSEKKTLSVFTWFAGQEDWGAKDFNDIRAYQAMEELTGVHIDWSMLSDTNKFDLMMSSGETTDIIWYSWTPARQKKYADAGLIADVAPLLEENGPDILATMEQYPAVKKQLTAPGGAQYLISWLTPDQILVTSGEGFSIRQDWLDKLGLEMPKTADQLFDTLVAFREQDANGNGEKDEIITGYPPQLQKIFFGFGSAYSAYQLAEDGKTVVYSPISENYKNALKWFAALAEEGVLDPDYTSWDNDIYEKKVMEDRVAFYVDNSAVIGGFELKAQENGLAIDYAPMPYLEYNGKVMSYNSTAKRAAQHYGATVATSASDPALAVEWLNAFFTEEGNTIMNWGIEGESYNVVDGEKVLTDTIMNAEKGADYEMTKYTHRSFAGVEQPESRFAAFTDDAMAFTNIWSKVDPSLAMEPYVFFTDEQSEIINQYNTELKTAVETWTDKFMTGAADVDAEWDNYVKELESYGYKEVLAVQQAALDAYLAK